MQTKDKFCKKMQIYLRMSKIIPTFAPSNGKILAFYVV